MIRKLCSGNSITSYIATLFSDIACVYPITPSTSMAEYFEESSVKGVRNIFNTEIKTQEMQSEAGAIACCHGALLAGKYATTFTSSQGLLLMIPEMYKISGELLPMVMHVAARSLSTHALSIYNDHQDVMAVRQTGFYMICSASVQECYWNSIKAHLIAINENIPVLHFFDGFNTSHKLETIEVLEEEELISLIKNSIDWEKVLQFRSNSVLSVPQTIGTNQQYEYADLTRERIEKYNQVKYSYDAITLMLECATKVETNNSVDWYGVANPKKVIVSMGSVCGTVKTLVDMHKTEVSLLQVNQFRPVSDLDQYLSRLGDYAEIYVIDRTIEPGATSPLALDVINSLYNQDIMVHESHNKVYVLNIGLSSEDISISMLEDKLGLEHKEEPDIRSVLIKGKGSEGLVTATKWIAEVLFNQGYFVQALSIFSAYKSAGDTISQLRVSPCFNIDIQSEVKILLDYMNQRILTLS